MATQSVWSRFQESLDRGHPERAANLLLGVAVVLSVALAGTVVAWKRHQGAAQQTAYAQRAGAGPPSFANSPQVIFFTNASCMPCAEALVAVRAVDWPVRGMQLLVTDTAANGAALQRDTMNWAFQVPDHEAATLPALFTRDGAFFGTDDILTWLRSAAEAAE